MLDFRIGSITASGGQYNGRRQANLPWSHQGLQKVRVSSPPFTLCMLRRPALCAGSEATELSILNFLGLQGSHR